MTPARRRGTLTGVLVATVLSVAACGGGAADEDAAAVDDTTSGNTGTVSETAGDGATATDDEGLGNIEAPFSVNKEAWHSGFHVTFEDGLFTGIEDTFTQEVDYEVAIDTTFENLGESEWSMSPDRFALVSNGNAIAASFASEMPTVPSGLASTGRLVFEVDGDFDPANSQLVIGGAGEARAEVPLGDGESVTLEPSTTSADGTIGMELVDLTFEDADLRYDVPGSYSAVDEGEVALTLHFGALSRNGGNWNIFPESFALIMPDGTAATPSASVLGSLPGSEEGVATGDLELTFLVPDPAQGDYVLRLTLDDWFVGDDGVAEGSYEFTLP